MGWRPWARFCRPWRRGCLRGRRGTWWILVTSTFVSRGRRGTIWHPRSFCVAGVALMVLGGALGPGFVACDARGAAPLCVAGVALGDIHLRFTWQLWHKLTSTVVLRGRRGPYGVGWRAWARFCRLWRRGCLRGRRGTWWHPLSFHVAGVALGHIYVGFAWQAWHLWHWVAPLGPVLSPVTPRLFAWQAWHLVTSTFVSRGRCGTWSHLRWFCVAGVAPSLTNPLSHTTLSHTIFHTPSFTPNFVTHHLSRTIFHTPLCHPPSLTHHLSHTTLPHTHTIFHTPLCHTPSLTHPLLHTIFVTHHLSPHHPSHTTLSHTIFHHTILHTHTQLCHTPSFATPSFTHHFVTHHLSPHHLPHTIFHHPIFHTTLSHTIFRHTIFHTPLCHTPSFTHNFVTRSLSHTTFTHTHTPSFTHCFVTHTPSFFVTHHLSHSTLSLTTVLTSRSFTASFPLPSFPVPATTFHAYYLKKLTCGVIRSFNFSVFFVIPIATADMWLLHLVCTQLCIVQQHCARAVFAVLVLRWGVDVQCSSADDFCLLHSRLTQLPNAKFLL